MPQTCLSVEAMLDRFEALGLARPCTLSADQLTSYGPIYRQRQSKQHLSGLEPDFGDTKQLQAFLEPWKTLIGLAIPYDLLPSNRKGAANAISQVSIMAWEWDYHEYIRKLIQTTLADVNPGCYTIHIDSGPLPERQTALMMGLARPGRSQMLIHPDYGTAFYLAFVLTTAQMEPPKGGSTSEPAFELSEHCRDCRRCQSHCPAKVLTGEADFDGSGCLSALSQKKGRLNEGEMKALGLKLYGCDQCQLNCPANDPKRSYSDLAAIITRRSTANVLDPESLLDLSQKAFKARYGQAGFAWRGLKTLRRNALINMGNSRDQRWISVLEAYLSHQAEQDGDVLSDTAAWALAQLKNI